VQSNNNRARPRVVDLYIRVLDKLLPEYELGGLLAEMRLEIYR